MWRFGCIVLAAALIVPMSLLARIEAAEKPVQQPFGIGMPDSDQPISIRADELEAISRDGERQLIFTANVHVEQADVRIESDRLEAYYPKGAKQPDRLVATGNVRLIQKAVEARCDHAIYERVAQTLLCEGAAELRDGDNRVAGARIEFDLAREIVRVKGGASVLIVPERGKGSPAAPQSAAQMQRVAGGAGR